MDFAQLESLIQQAVSVADNLLPAGAIASKKALAVGYLVATMEKTDNLAPGMFAQWLDLPAVDQLQYEVVEAAVDWMLARLKLEGQ